MNTKKRLSKLLASAGVASRRACEELIFSGRVQVNGKRETQPQTLVSFADDQILIDGRPVSSDQKKVYFILNKPSGYLCTARKEGGKKIVFDLFSHLNIRLFTVGRLDRDTNGLLLLTNDGHFANRVIHPSSNISKEYLVKCDRDVSHQQLVKISEGVAIEGVWVKPSRVLKVRRGTLKITVKEGKKREVRLMVEKAELGILSLTRIRIGNLTLGGLPLGSWRPLSEQEKEQIFQ